MKNLIDDTLTPLENCVESFKRDYATQIKEWREELKDNSS